ncbi:MAG: hypothetical protein ACKO6Q_04415 [Bacteroidota bacterium]
MKNVLLLLTATILLSCGNGKSGTSGNAKSEKKSEEKAPEDNLPLAGKIKDINRGKNKLEVLVMVECLVDEKTKPNLLMTKLLDEDGLGCTPEFMDSRDPMFPTTELYKGDKASGWLTFKYPNSNFVPKKIVFSKVLGGKLCEIPITE